MFLFLYVFRYKYPIYEIHLKNVKVMERWVRV